MSIAALTQLYDEMRRLAIAGSNVAVGNARLQKLIPPLQKSGEKAPVFAKVAQATQAVVESSEKTAPGALLDLAALVNAILYTQGTTGIAGTLESIETTELGVRQTQTSARMIKPLLAALTTTGSGRLETIRDAFERGAFGDLRLVKPALGALDDPYPEIADFIADKVLPVYGKAVLPELRRSFDLKGKGGHARRLKLMHELDPVGTREVVKQVLDDGSKELRVVAIECLGGSDEDLAFLLEQSRSRAKEVRVSALRALTKLDAAEAVEAVKNGTAGGDLQLLIDTLSNSRNSVLMQFVLTEADRQFEALLKLKDKQEQGKAVGRLQLWLQCLYSREDAEAEAFVLKCFDRTAKLAAIKSDPSGADINELVCILLAHGSERMREKLISSRESLAGPSVGEMYFQAFLAARRTLSPANLFEMFAPILMAAANKRPKKNSLESERQAAIREGLTLTTDDWREGQLISFRTLRGLDRKSLPDFDPRWLDIVVSNGDEELVRHLARPGHVAANRFLVERVNDRNQQMPCLILSTMIRIQHPDSTDCVLRLLENAAKPSADLFIAYRIGRLIPRLPPEAVPRLEALVPKLPDRLADHLMDYVVELKNKPPEIPTAS